MPFEIPNPEDLRRWRQALGLTQAELAKRAGVSQPLIARIEKGTVDPRMSTVRGILRALSQAERAEIKVREVMTSEVVAVKASEPVAKAIELMRDKNFSQLPVMRGSVPVGSISERVIVHKLHEARTTEDVSRATVQEVMGPAFPTVDADASLDTVYGLLENHYAVMVMERGRVVGVMTQADLLRLFEGRKGPRSQAASQG